MKMTTNDLLKRFYALRTKYGERDERYRANWYAYTGEYEKLFANYQSDPLTIGATRKERTIQKWNLVRPIVDAHKTLINQLPTIEVPAPVLGDEMAALKADKQEKALYALWDTIRMKRKHGEGSFNLALNWATVWQVAWDEEDDLPDVIVRAPGETYPVMKHSGDETAYCFFRWEEDADSLAERYPKAKSLLTRSRLGHSFTHNIEVIEFVDDVERLLFLGGDVKSLVEGVGGKHKLPLCPVVITSASCIPGEIFPPGPIDQLVSMNDHLNRFQTKLGEAIEETLFGWHDLIGEGAADAPLNTGPGAANRYEGDIRHEYTQPQAPPSQAFGHVDLVQRLMRNLANWPDVASGDSDASVITGKGVSRMRYGMDAQAAEVQSNLGDDLAVVNSIMFRMLETYRPDKRFELYATESITTTSAPGRPRSFGVSIVPSEDIKGYYRNSLHYSPFGADMNASIQIGMQLVNERIWSRSRLRNLIPGSSDAEGEQAEIEEEDRRRMQMEVDLQVQAQERIMQAQMRQQMQLAAMQQGGGAGAGAEGASVPSAGNAPPMQGGSPAPAGPAGGEMIGGNTMLMPSGQPQMMGMGEPMTGTEGFPIEYTPLKPYGPALAELAGTGTHGASANAAALSGQGIAPGEQPGASAVTMEEAIQVLSSVGKLKGQVYLLEDIVERGFTEGSVAVGLTSMIDKATVSNAIRDTKLHGRVRFVDVSKGLPPGAMPVAGTESQAA